MKETHNSVVAMERSMSVGILITPYFRGAQYIAGHRHFENHRELKEWLLHNFEVGYVTARRYMILTDFPRLL